MYFPFILHPFRFLTYFISVFAGISVINTNVTITAILEFRKMWTHFYKRAWYWLTTKTMSKVNDVM
jgi:hypothetical protein